MRNYGTNEPDLSQCRTSRVGSIIPGSKGTMYYCRIDNDECKYARPLGFDYICRHPDSHGFLMPEKDAPEISSTSLFACAVG